MTQRVEVYSTVDIDHVEGQLLAAVQVSGFGRIASNALLAVRGLRARVDELERSIWSAHSFYDEAHDVVRHDFTSDAEEIEELRCTCGGSVAHKRGCWCGPQEWHIKEGPDHG